MTLEAAVGALMPEVPEFAASLDADKVLGAEDKRDPHIVFGEFGNFLEDRATAFPGGFHGFGEFPVSHGSSRVGGSRGT